jgi:hypothetical protein
VVVSLVSMCTPCYAFISWVIDGTPEPTESRTELSADSSCSIFSFSAVSSANVVGCVPWTPFVRAADTEGV